MESCKFIIRNAVATALENVTDSFIEAVVNIIMDEAGVQKEDDLKLLKERDLVPTLKPVQARKLLILLQKGNKDVFLISFILHNL